MNKFFKALESKKADKVLNVTGEVLSTIFSIIKDAVGCFIVIIILAVAAELSGFFEQSKYADFGLYLLCVYFVYLIINKQVVRKFVMHVSKKNVIGAKAYKRLMGIYLIATSVVVTIIGAVSTDFGWYAITAAYLLLSIAVEFLFPYWPMMCYNYPAFIVSLIVITVVNAFLTIVLVQLVAVIIGFCLVMVLISRVAPKSGVIYNVGGGMSVIQYWDN